MRTLDETSKEESAELLKNGREKIPVDNVRDKQQPEDQQDTIALEQSHSRRVQTFATFLLFIGLGMSLGCYSPTVVNLEILMNTNIEGFGFAMMSGCAGYFLGSLIGGTLVDRINRELLFATAGLFLAASITLYPWVPNVYVFAALQGMNTAASGAADTAGQAYLLMLWNGAPSRESMFQALHVSWSVGATLAPFVMTPFISPISGLSGCQTLDVGSSHVEVNVTGGTTVCNVTSVSQGVDRVRYGFAIIGLVNLLASMLFFVIFFAQGPSFYLSKDAAEVPVQAGPTTQEDPRYKTIFLLILFLFCLVYIPMEIIPGSFISAMAVKGLGWNVNLAGFLAGVYWGSTCLGRLLAVPVSAKCSPRQMLLTGLAMTALSFLVLSLFARKYTIVVWLATGLSGFSTSCIFNTCVLWASNYIWFSGTASGVLLIGASLGGMIAFPLVGYLSNTYSYLWIVYLPFLAAVADTVIFVGLQMFAALYPQQNDSEENENKTTLR